MADSRVGACDEGCLAPLLAAPFIHSLRNPDLFASHESRPAARALRTLRGFRGGWPTGYGTTASIEHGGGVSTSIMCHLAWEERRLAVNADAVSSPPSEYPKARDNKPQSVQSFPAPDVLSRASLRRAVDSGAAPVGRNILGNAHWQQRKSPTGSRSTSVVARPPAWRSRASVVPRESQAARKPESART